MKDELLLSINLLDYNLVCNLFQVKNDKCLDSHQQIQHSKELLALTKDINKVRHNPKIVIFNFSNYNRIKQKETLLSKGLQFANPPTEIEHIYFILPFELLHRDIKSEEVHGENLNILRNIKY